MDGNSSTSGVGKFEVFHFPSSPQLMSGTRSLPIFAPPGDVAKMYGLSTATLARWYRKGHIRGVQPGASGRHLYDVDSVHAYTGASTLFPGCRAHAEDNGPNRAVTSPSPRVRAVYARVSSVSQRSDLERQVASLVRSHPGHRVFRDFGSGLNFHRRQFTQLLDLVIDGRVEEVVVAHRDRLGRFAVELVEHVFRRHGTRLVVENTPASDIGADSDLRDDLLAATTYFVAQHNGRRSAANRRKRKREVEGLGAGQAGVSGCADTDQVANRAQRVA